MSSNDKKIKNDKKDKKKKETAASVVNSSTNSNNTSVVQEDTTEEQKISFTISDSKHDVVSNTNSATTSKDEPNTGLTQEQQSFLLNLMQIIPAAQMVDAQKCHQNLSACISTDISHGAYSIDSKTNVSRDDTSRTNVRREVGAYSISNDVKNKSPTSSAYRLRSNDDSDNLYGDAGESSDTLPYKGNKMNRKRKPEHKVHTNLKKFKTQADLSKDVDIGERVSIFAEDSDMDKKVNDLCESSEHSTEESDINLEDISQDLFDDDEVGPPISEGLSDLFQNIKDKPLPKHKIAEKCKKS